MRTLADVVGGSFSRLQFTPDLMPGDIVGTRVWRPSTETFDIELGPVFANLVLADEINRAPAKVQSALLEAMAERQVSIGGAPTRCPTRSWCWPPRTRSSPRASTRCPRPSATASCSRSTSTYPNGHEEFTILQRMSVAPAARRAGARPRPGARAAAGGRRGLRAPRGGALRRRPGDGHPRTRTATGSATSSTLELGVSPRATLGLVAAARALALLRGRDYVLPTDVVDVASDVLSHRLVLSFDAVADGIDPRHVVATLALESCPRPQIAPHQIPREAAGR